jgi:hypothetical protein
MAITITLKKSSVNGKRPFPTDLTFGELALNYSTSDSGVYFKNAAGTLQKVGAAFVGPNAPNSAGTGSPGNALGELWYSTDLKSTLIWDGTNWCYAGAPLASTVVPGIVLAQTDPQGSAFENTFLGGGSGGGGVTPMVGDHNVAIGVLAMEGKTTEQRSVAVGYNALSNQNIGVSGGNIAIGSDTALSFTEGFGNIFLGFNAGQFNTVGCGNVLIGYGVETSSPAVSNELVIGNVDLGGPNYWIRGDENRNVALGAGLIDCNGLIGTAGQVLASSGDGVIWGSIPVATPATPTSFGLVYGCSLNGSAFSTSVGFNALRSLTIGANNTAVGYYSLCSVVTGNCNTAVGMCALRRSTGSCNTALGESAGWGVTSGNNNTFLGYISGSLLSAASSGNTIVGSCAGLTFETGSNNTIVGHNALGEVVGGDGSENVLVGYCSAYNLEYGCGNVVIGPKIAVANSRGNQQLVIGSNYNSNNITWIRGNSTGAVQFANTILDSGGNTGATGQYLSRNGSGGLTWVNGVGAYVLPYATTTVLGGVCVDGTTITVSPTGVISAGAQSVPSATPTVAGIVFGCSSAAANGTTAFGNFALASVTTGTLNTAIGQNAFSSLRTGTRNTANGYCAGSLLVGGSDNIAIGTNALQVSTASSGNTAIGGFSLSAMTANDPGNVAVGFCSLPALNGAGQACRNVAVGCQAGLGLVSGRHNLFLGHASGRNVTTGCGNVVIGACVQVADPAASLQLVIGSNDWITGGNWITGDSGFNVQIVRGLRDTAGNLGTSGQALTSTGSGTAWGSVATSAATPVVAGTVFAKTCVGGPTYLGQCAGNNTSTSVSNTGIGFAALQNLSSGSGSLNNTAVGYCAQNVGALVSNNTSVGTCTLRGSVGERNTAVGALAGQCVATSNGVVAVGASALSGTVLGGNLNNSVAVGNCALASAINGVNTALGGFAGQCITTANFNTLIGQSAGLQITTGSNNTALGDGALRSGGTSNGNVAIGNAALSVGAPGNFNVALGYNSMCGGSTGAAGNVAIGATALSVTTGGCNVAVGLNAGSLLTTGSNNVLIGPNVQAPSATASGQMAIGYGTNYWIRGNTDKSVQFGAGIVDCNLSNGGAGYVLGSAGAAGVTWKIDGVLGNWWIRENGTNLDFRLVGNASVLMRLSNTGDLQVRGNITAFATLP